MKLPFPGGDESYSRKPFRRPRLTNDFEALDDLRDERDEYYELWKRTGASEERGLFAERAKLVEAMANLLGDRHTFDQRLTNHLAFWADDPELFGLFSAYAEVRCSRTIREARESK